MTDHARTITWEENGAAQTARYLALRNVALPSRVTVLSDATPAQAFALLSQGTAILWRGDYPAARRLLDVIRRRFDDKRSVNPNAKPADAFNAHRMSQAQRARILGLLLVPLAADRIDLERGQGVAAALHEALGDLPPHSLIPLVDLLALVSAHEWRRNGVSIRALDGAAVHPHFGVFPPTRQDYVDLVATAPLPVTDLAFDLGVGSGVLSAVLMHRGIARVVATDNAPRAIACARDNLDRLGYSDRFALRDDALYPPGSAGLIVCNPPWLPSKASTALESAVYDPDSQMLDAFLDGAAAHLAPGGEAWLIMSNLAELLGLRQPDELTRRIADAGLRVIARLDAPPESKSARNRADPLYFARSREVVSLWRLGSSQPHRP